MIHINIEIKVWCICLFYCGLSIFFLNSCKKEEPIIKKDPIITWVNPADITFETALSQIQLNAKADIRGTFVYTPSMNTIMDVGINQDLSLDFYPLDSSKYNTVHKKVKINVKIEKINFNPNILYDTLSDIDGNVYKTVSIGNQIWMAENLRTTRFRNGKIIPEISDWIKWENANSAYCIYNNVKSVEVISVYGRLYNYHVVVDTNGIAPFGWHVASVGDWLTLFDFLGNYSVSGYKLMEAGSYHWNHSDSDIISINNFGFTCIPSGGRFDTAIFKELAYKAFYWSKNNDLNNLRDYYYIQLNRNGFLYINNLYYHYPRFGLAIRLVKDN
jgi:uncharacterized protein (TIGR02145 family)